MLQFRNVINLARPVQALFGLLTYWLGLGFAHYLGATIKTEPQLIGAGIVILMLVASNLLLEYFRHPNDPFGLNETKTEREVLRSILLFVSIGILTTISILVFLLARDGFMFLEAALIVALFIVLALFSAVPPFRLANRGLAELSTSIQIASLSPSLAFLFQYGSFHRILTIYTFPLLLLLVAYFLITNFRSYSADLKFERRSMLICLTWERAIPIHNLLIVVAYLFFAFIPFFGIPFGLVWPALVTLPIAGYQVITLRNLGGGARPMWPIVIAAASAIFGLTTYLITLTFWLR